MFVSMSMCLTWFSQSFCRIFFEEENEQKKNIDNKNKMGLNGTGLKFRCSIKCSRVKSISRFESYRKHFICLDSKKRRVKLKNTVKKAKRLKDITRKKFNFSSLKCFNGNFSKHLPLFSTKAVSSL